ncbi:hypothetical protein PAXINDRAFT_16888 [Paxillus involutus ATCC 200175]|uniref:Ubiquitin-like protease family profile domain-containing protein n=1 Tax=Paxillus involutus ATCC 200175 TaxID=664439 RepID=A0A0C9T3A8_PAXIN|nr:hypothetical protein PAXINDRAFT_16888 [Paxillus involutus ATCC 200175]
MAFPQASTQNKLDLTSHMQTNNITLPGVPPRYLSFIPIPKLSFSALLDFTNIPPFDLSLSGLDPAAFLSNQPCNSNLPDNFLDHSIPPFITSVQLINLLAQALSIDHHCDVFVLDPQHSGNLPSWVIQYWHDLRRASIAKGCWSSAHDWLTHQTLTSTDTALSTIADQVLHDLQVLEWDDGLCGPAASLQTLNLVEFLASTSMKGRFIDVMVNEVSYYMEHHPLPSELGMISVEELTFSNMLQSSHNHWSRYTFDKRFSRLHMLGNKLCDGELNCVIFPINVNGVHWTVFLINATKRVIHYSDSLDWPWPKDDVDLIQRWLCTHGFSPFSKGAAIPHGLQEDSFSCVIAMINIICHHLFSIPLFTNKAHFNEKDSFHDTPDTDPDCHTSPCTNTSQFSSPVMSDTSS